MNYLLNILGLNNLSFSEFLWVSFGTLGQLIFFCRWIVQWLSSEKKQSSVIPVAFWWCSLVGGLITLIYAKHIESFPFMLAQAVGLIVYSRNLILIYKKHPLVYK